MKQLGNIRADILSVVGNGEILIIVPPFGSIYDSALGPHILQTLAREKGYETDILYLNMLLARVIGLEHYEEIHDAPQFWMLGERFFARSAHGLPPLGKNAAACADEAMAISGGKTNPVIPYETIHRFDLETYLGTEQICIAFIDEVISVITSLNYKIIGCANSMMGHTNCGVALINGIKKNAPGTITIMGGGKCKDEMAEGLASLSADIDYIFSGESENAFLNFLNDYSAGKRPSQRIITGKPLSRLDTLPLGDYTVFFKQYYRFIGDINRERIRIWHETSRGCWWAEKSKCTFCSEHPISHRQKSIDKVVREIKEIKDSIGDQLLYMADSIMPLSYHRELLPVLDKQEQFPPLTYQLRTTIGLKGLVNLKNARILAVLPGIETFSSHLLKLMSKGVSGSQNLLFLRNATSVGIIASWFLLWGFPGDKLADYEEVLELLPLIRHLQPPLDFRPIRFARFSPYLYNQQKYKMTDVKPWAVFDKVYPHWAQLENLAPYYSCRYPCQLSENPDIIREIGNQVTIWEKTWKNTKLAMKPFMDAFAIYDNRDIHTKAKTHILDYPQAREIMTGHVNNGSENLKWAVEEKLGAVIDSRYVPLVTAPPGLLLAFEEKEQA
jgi:ribosomal peptide maturation radical SAM protein 1